MPSSPVNLGHQRILILNADPALSTHTTHLPELTLFLHLAFILHFEGKMRFYLHPILSFICYFYQSTSTKIKPELKKNILNFSYGINYKYEGMLAHLFDRFYVVTKFILLSIGYLKFSMLNYDNTCTYLDIKSIHNADTKKHLSNL